MSSISVLQTLTKRVESYLGEHAIGPQSSVLVAYSGGPDSTALLWLLSKIFPGNIVSCYVDHHLRGERERARELDIVLTTADRLGVRLVVRTVEAGAISERARREKRSIEESARHVRYAELQTALEMTGASRIALGHTLNDQVETVLMRLFQGSSIAGLKGIPEQRGPIIRPLLATSRDEIMACLAELQIPYSMDSTNLDADYLRNRMRRTVLPEIQKIFPQYLSGVAAIVPVLKSASAALEYSAAQLLPWKRTNRGFEVDGVRFASVPFAIQTASLLSLYNAIGQGGRIPARFFSSLSGYTAGINGVKLRGHGGLLEERRGAILFRKDVVLDSKKSYLIRVRGPDIYHIIGSLSFEMIRTTGMDATGGALFLSDSVVQPPVVVRSRRPGDSIQMKTGRKPLAKLFADWKVESRHRDWIPVIEDRDGILAVAGGVMGYRNRVRRGVERMAGEREEEDGMAFVFQNTGDES
ncbi:MAG TPA: tRNA lysidine(34) synthetase TilS [Spirochaetia bacterium]|nr:tRNA lysidine(34) synthetase TilS [Spirochaetia bacterium]